MESKERIETVLRALKEFGVEYELYEHKAVFTVEEMNELDLPRPEAGAKNLFLRDDKKRNYYLLTVREDRPINLKEVRKKMGVRPLSFASEDDLNAKLGLTRGSVTPLGVINNTETQISGAERFPSIPIAMKGLFICLRTSWQSLSKHREILWNFSNINTGSLLWERNREEKKWRMG